MPLPFLPPSDSDWLDHVERWQAHVGAGRIGKRFVCFDPQVPGASHPARLAFLRFAAGGRSALRCAGRAPDERQIEREFAPRS